MRVPWPVLIVALTLPTAGALVYFVAADPGSSIFRVSYATSKIVQFALPVAALLVFERRRLRGIHFSARGFGAGVAFGLLTSAAIGGLYVFALRDSVLLSPVADAVRTKVSGLGMDSPGGYAALAVFLSVAHSVLEEYYWRWFVYAALRQRAPPAVAIVLSSIAFAAHHVIVLDVYFPGRFWTATLPFSLGVAVGGACWAWLFDRYQSLAGPWAAHALSDVALMAVGFDLLYR